MQRIPDHVKSTFQQATPKGWAVESVAYLPIPGWDCDMYVCRITDGINTGYLETDHGRVVKSSKAKIKARLTAYRDLINHLINLGEEWL